MMRYFIWYQQPNPRNQGKLGADVLVLCKCFSKSWVTNAKKTCLVNGFGVGGEEVIRLSLPSVFFFIAFSAFLCVINSCMIIDCPYPCSYCSFIPFFSSLFIGGHCPFPHPPPLPLYPDAPSFIVPGPQEASKTDQFISNWLLASRDLKPFALRLQDPLRSSETQIRKVWKLKLSFFFSEIWLFTNFKESLKEIK